MNKATVGMILLGAVVFTKAFLIERSSDNVVSRATDLSVSIQENITNRSNDHVEVMPMAELMASNAALPVITLETNDSYVEEVQNSLVVNTAEMPEIVSADISTEVVEEVIPMDVVSNTGYGMWISSSERITSKEERDGIVPLDRGNTISDNIAKLFPRVP